MLVQLEPTKLTLSLASEHIIMDNNYACKKLLFETFQTICETFRLAIVVLPTCSSVLLITITILFSRSNLICDEDRNQTELLISAPLSLLTRFVVYFTAVYPGSFVGFRVHWRIRHVRELSQL